MPQLWAWACGGPWAPARAARDVAKKVETSFLLLVELVGMFWCEEDEGEEEEGVGVFWCLALTWAWRSVVV